MSKDYFSTFSKRKSCYRLKGLKYLQFTLGTEILFLFKTEMDLKDLRIKI